MTAKKDWLHKVFEIATRGPRFDHTIDCPSAGKDRYFADGRVERGKRCACGANQANTTLDEIAAMLNGPGFPAVYPPKLNDAVNACLAARDAGVAIPVGLLRKAIYGIM